MARTKATRLSNHALFIVVLLLTAPTLAQAQPRVITVMEAQAAIAARWRSWISSICLEKCRTMIML